MIRKKTFLVLFVFILAINIVYAQEVVYLAKNSINVDQNYIDALEEVGFSVNVVFDSEIPSTDFDNYHMIFIGDGLFSNYDRIPVTDKECLIANTHHLDDWKIAGYAGIISIGNNYLKGKIVYNETPITEGIESPVRLYDDYGVLGYYLPRLPNRARGTKNIIGTDNFDQNPLLGIIPEGETLYPSGTSNAKTAFFGIIKTDDWTEESETLFKRTALWLVDHYNFPVIVNISVEDINNDSAKVICETDRPTNVTLYYGTDLNMNDIIEIENFVENHEVLIENLEESITYFYQIKVCSNSGFCKNSSVFNFTTLDLTYPTLVSTSVENLTNSSAIIRGQSNEIVSAELFFGENIDELNPPLGGGVGDEFGFGLSDLNENTQYFYLIKMCDLSNNCANSSIYNFTTLDFTAPSAPENLILEVINSNNIKIKWDASAGSSQYNIYMSDNSDVASFDLQTISVTTTSTEYIDNSASSIKQKYYIVRAEDAAGNKENNTNIVGKFDLELKQGYNLVSFPILPFDVNINSVMHQNNSYHPISEIITFNENLKEFETSIYSDTWTGQVNNLFPLKGYFFKAEQRTDFTIVGHPQIEYQLDLVDGMNLVGLTLFENQRIEQIITQSPANHDITEISSRNIDGSYNIATYYGLNRWFNEFEINPGKCYWLKANKNSTLVIS